MRNLYLNLRPIFVLGICVLLFFSLSRSILVFLMYSRVEAVSALQFVFLQGLRFDFVLLGMIMLLPLLAFTILGSTRFTHRIFLILLSIYVPLVVMITLFMELATTPFVEQFDARPNVLFFEYIDRPKEVFATIWGAYKVPLIVGVTLVVVAGFMAYRIVRRLLSGVRPVSLFKAVPICLVLSLVCAVAIRSTFGSRPISPSFVAQTNDSLVNDLPLNSTYTVAYAAYELSY